MGPTGLAVRGSRGLLRQIREAMAGQIPAQAKLDMVVRIIARSMVAEVCSLYLRRSHGDLELFATEGLAREAVHVTRLKAGEGLVGEIVRLGRPLNLSDAPNHPAFAYRPETGEDPYHAFLGVPLLRGGRGIGVLVVQNATTRTYSEEEVEDLQIIAMVLAELVGSGDILGEAELRDVEIAPHRPERVKGAKFADGLAFGVAVLHEAPVAVGHLLSDDPVAEEARLKVAVNGLQAQIDQMLEGEGGLIGASYEVLDTYRMFAHDRGWNRSLEEAVRSGLTAEAAVERVRSEHRARLGKAKDPYLRERLHDLEDLNDRLLRHLSGDGDVARELPDNAILIARNLGPADLLEYDRTKLKGILLEEGSTASHAAIVARALDIPCVGRLPGLRDRLSQGDPVIVDAESGEAFLRPRPDVIKAMNARLEVRTQRKAEFAKLRDTPAFTRDGAKITLLMNAGLAVDLDILRETGAEGIGLFRTEFQFMVAEELPRLEAQTSLYQKVFEAADGMPVTFRTLDLGGDKLLPYMEAEREENPALGWRAIRMGLDRPALLKMQVRALIWAAKGRPLRIMFPLVANVDEFRAARAMVDNEVAWALRRGRPAPSRLDVGAMIEAPSLIWHLDALLPMTDFVSVGTNDLMQYLFAADRGNPRVADRYDPLSPPALRALKTIQSACAETGTPVSVCGEMAGRPLEAFALTALGFDRLSMPPAGIGPVKQMVLSCDREAASRGVNTLIKSAAGSIRNEIETLARKLYVAV
ncbi:phosphoenolpyruvate--protein phosphotransferase [Caulobacter sp. NIBR1757]|uniref:phosphoenolpyruvate--protein phosphotransferase n=1 Tax=Caulobacter sp. NIBR1757 TaxID=3016000 RepID=UPI0022F04BF6|nr:phosphoenolpyruvate--protein phosphotransferase [Caulobacter sp. NIBR1757]WGM40614.1 Phosphoenolpyruvate-dependent phosphotransferase system [Caulobacter sp. NIBR1757]